MSAYICSDATINVVVTHIHLNRDLDWLKREFIEALLAIEPNSTAPFESFGACLGKALFALNVDAVEQRYGVGEARKFRSLDYKFQLETASQMKVYRAIGELTYQMSEGNVPTTKLYGLLVRSKASVADGIIESIGEMHAELENSLYARCKACCRGVEHDDEHCGAPVARGLLVGTRR